MKKALPKLKKELWKLVSEYIRRSQSDENGIGTCISCGSRKHWKMMDAGHFIPQSAGDALRFEEINIHIQCKVCNIWNKEMGKIGYANFMVKKYGKEVVDELDQRRRKIKKFTRPELEELIETYKEKLENLEGEILGKH